MQIKNLVANVVDPKLWHNPNTIKLTELQKYVSLDQIKMQSSMRNYKASMLYIGGTLLGCLVTKMVLDNYVKWFMFGENGNGGYVLKMHTKNTVHDYTYNRQFQRLRWLSEEPTGDDPTVRTSEALLVDLGVKVEPRGANLGVRKLIPHDKYLI